MHNCIKASLTPAYLKTIINILPSFAQDGPKFIYYIITNKHVKSILFMRNLLQDLGNLDLKKFGYNIKKLHAEVDHLIAQLKANKAEPDDLTIMMHLIAAYRTNSTNTQFLQHVANLESDWSRGVIMTSTQLRTQCETHINTMIRNGNWRAQQRAPKPKPTALTTDSTKPLPTGTQDPQDAIAKCTPATETGLTEPHDQTKPTKNNPDSNPKSVYPTQNTSNPVQTQQPTAPSD